MPLLDEREKVSGYVLGWLGNARFRIGMFADVYVHLAIFNLAFSREDSCSLKGVTVIGNNDDSEFDFCLCVFVVSIEIFSNK